MKRSGVYLRDSKSHRRVPLLLQEQVPNEYGHMLYMHKAVRDRPYWYRSVAHLVKRRINNVHATESEGYYDVIY